MTKEQLQSVSDWFHASPQRISTLKAVNGICVGSAAAAFFYGVLVRPGFQDKEQKMVCQAFLNHTSDLTGGRSRKNRNLL